MSLRATSIGIGAWRVDGAFLCRMLGSDASQVTGLSEPRALVKIQKAGKGKELRLQYEWSVPEGPGDGARVAKARIEVIPSSAEDVQLTATSSGEGSTRAVLHFTKVPEFTAGEQKGAKGRTTWLTKAAAAGNAALPLGLREALRAETTHELELQEELEVVRCHLLGATTRKLLQTRKRPQVSAMEMTPPASKKRPLEASTEKRRAPDFADSVVQQPGTIAGSLDSTRGKGAAAASDAECEWCGSTAEDVEDGSLQTCKRCKATFCGECSGQHSGRCRRLQTIC